MPWSAAAVKGVVSLDRGEHRGMLGGGGDQARVCGGRPVGGGVRVRATRGQTDIRGLVTAGRAVRLERSAGLKVERGFGFFPGLLIVNRPGSGGGTEATGEWFDASTEEVSERVA